MEPARLVGVRRGERETRTPTGPCRPLCPHPSVGIAARRNSEPAARPWHHDHAGHAGAHLARHYCNVSPYQLGRRWPCSLTFGMHLSVVRCLAALEPILNQPGHGAVLAGIHAGGFRPNLKSGPALYRRSRCRCRVFSSEGPVITDLGALPSGPAVTPEAIDLLLTRLVGQPMRWPCDGHL
jgi:hypothetical protein